jgi:L-fucose isomerase-like protein
METRDVLFSEMRSEYQVDFFDNESVLDFSKDDALVIAFIATGGVEEKFEKYYKKLSSPIVIMSDSFHNSLAASLEISSWLHNKGIKHKHINFPFAPSKKFLEGFHSDLSELYNIQKTSRKISESVVGLIGGESSWLISSKVDVKYIHSRYGTKFIPIPINKVEEYFRNENQLDPDIILLKSKIIDKLEQNRSEKDVFEAIKLFSSLKKIINDYNLNALTIKCFDLLHSCNTTSCLALALLNDVDIVSGCEGDIPSLWSMLIAKNLCNSPSFMANPSSVQREDNTIDFAHCTAPLSLSKSYTLPSHFESGIGIGIAAQMPLGKYTIFKCGGEKLDKFYAFEGEIVQNTSVVERCRTQIKFRFKSDFEIDQFLTSHLGNHTIIIPGKHKKEIIDFFNLN